MDSDSGRSHLRSVQFRLSAMAGVTLLVKIRQLNRLQFMKRTSRIAAILGVSAIGLWVVTLLLRPAPTPMPSPNGYDDFVAAAAARAGDPSNHLKWTQDELAVFVVKNANAFEFIAAGVAKECRAPSVRSSEEVELLLPRLASFKQLAKAIAARSRLAAMDGRATDAVRSALDGVQLGHGVSRGGVLIEALLGLACEQTALGQFPPTNDLDGKTALVAAQRLAQLDAQAPTVAEAVANERTLSQSAGGVTGAVSMAVIRLFRGDLMDAALKKFEEKWAAQAVRRRELILLLARRAYEVEMGKPPASDSVLVPGFLAVLPDVSQADTNSAKGSPQ